MGWFPTKRNQRTSSACGGIVRSAKTKAATGMISSCSESHLQHMFVIGENAGRRISDFSTRFRSGVSYFSPVGACYPYTILLVLNGHFQEIRHASIVNIDVVVYAWIDHSQKALEKQEGASL